MSVLRSVAKRLLPAREPYRWPPEASDGDKNLILATEPFTMTGRPRQWALLQAVRYIDRAGIEGDIVECGVWRGGSMMLAKAARIDTAVPRRYFLYDTFAGMTEPTAADVSFGGKSATALFPTQKRQDHSDWCYASLEEVKDNFAGLNLLGPDVVFKKGPVEKTLMDADDLPERIAILRLDTDWYESTKRELETLYPRLVDGGVLIIDDYGHWRGSKKAVDEYFGDRLPYLSYVDTDCRLAIKLGGR